MGSGAKRGNPLIQPDRFLWHTQNKYFPINRRYTYVIYYCKYWAGQWYKELQVFFVHAWSQVDFLLPHLHWLWQRVALSVPPRLLAFEVYITYIDIQQRGIQAFRQDNRTIDSHMVQVYRYKTPRKCYALNTNRKPKSVDYPVAAFLYCILWTIGVCG